MRNNDTSHKKLFQCWMVLLLLLATLAPASVLSSSCFSTAHAPCSISSPFRVSLTPGHHVPQPNKGEICCDAVRKPTSSQQCHCEQTGISDFFQSPAIIPPQNTWDNQPAEHLRVLSRTWINVPILRSFPSPGLQRQPISFALSVIKTTVLLI